LLIKAVAVRHNIDVKVDLVDEIPRLLLNENELKQVILNLARNGIAVMQNKGLLNIKTLNEQNKILLVVTDSGVGIAKEVIDNIFNPFYTTKEGGAGLLDRKIFDTLKEAQILIERWRWEYNTVRPHSARNYLPSAPKTKVVPLFNKMAV
jgi:nitrogen-specific signal transduction histidine kinase